MDPGYSEWRQRWDREKWGRRLDPDEEMARYDHISALFSLINRIGPDPELRSELPPLVDAYNHIAWHWRTDIGWGWFRQFNIPDWLDEFGRPMPQWPSLEEEELADEHAFYGHPPGEEIGRW